MKNPKKGEQASGSANPSANGMPETAPEHHNLRRWLMAGGGVAVLLTALLWFAGNIYFAKIQIGTQAFSSRLSDDTLAQHVAKTIETYKLTIQYPDGSRTSFSPDNMGITLDTYETIAQARHERKTLRARLQWWHPTKTAVVLGINRPALAAFTAQSITIATEAATNASLAITDDKVELHKEVEGKQYNLLNATRTILQAVETLQQQPLTLQTSTIRPDISNEHLAPVRNQIQSIMHQRLDVVIADQKITPSAKDIGSWLTLTPNIKDKTVDVQVDTAKVLRYLDGVAKAHNRQPKSQINNGSTVIATGTRGITVRGTQDGANTIGQKLLEAKDLQVELPVDYKDFRTVTAPTAGKWIEVDITAKRMYAYDQGAVVRTFLISAGAAATPTVTGSFAIYSKYGSKDMRGGNADGSNYFQPLVPWVNFFYRDYAIHGNYWRPVSYFGNVNSSHGCVGVLPGEGQWLYYWAPIGTPVIVHR